MSDPGFVERWSEAERLAQAAYRKVRPAARRLHRRMKLQQYTGYQFMGERGATPHHDDMHLAMKVVTTPDADYPSVRRFDEVTPGYTWHLRRQAELGAEALAVARTISLFVDENREPRLRCDGQVRPATQDDWKELAGNILEPWRDRAAHGTVDILRWIGAAPLLIVWLLMRVAGPLLVIAAIVFLIRSCT